MNADFGLQKMFQVRASQTSQKTSQQEQIKEDEQNYIR